MTAVDDDSVRFRWTGRKSGKEQITKLSGEEFLRRFLQHVLPRGLMRVRHFGWLSPAARARYARVRHLRRAGEAVLKCPDKVEICCPACGCARCQPWSSGGGAVSTVPPKPPSFYDFPEDIVNEKGDWTCHANSHCIVAGLVKFPMQYK